MNTLVAITLTQESLEETVIKMIKANIEEFKKDKNKATEKYMKLALRLRTKAYKHIQDNIDEVLIFIGSRL